MRRIYPNSCLISERTGTIIHAQPMNCRNDIVR